MSDSSDFLKQRPEQPLSLLDGANGEGAPLPGKEVLRAIKPRYTRLVSFFRVLLCGCATGREAADLALPARNKVPGLRRSARQPTSNFGQLSRPELVSTELVSPKRRAPPWPEDGQDGAPGV